MAIADSAVTDDDGSDFAVTSVAGSSIAEVLVVTDDDVWNYHCGYVSISTPRRLRVRTASSSKVKKTRSTNSLVVYWIHRFGVNPLLNDST